MTGRVIIVTGASSGLGYEVARYLCEGGNDVILACRSEEKANRAIEKIKRQNPNALATYMQLDLASTESIRKFVDDFHGTEKSLHVLVNNAGVFTGPKDTKRQFTKENFELTMGTNYLGHFLLTNLLLDDLKKAGSEENGDARIVTVTSSLHDPEANRRKNLQPMDFENFFLFNKGTHNGLQAYKNSKAAGIMFTSELARQLGEDSKVTANAVCPGFVPGTDLMRSSSGAQKFFHRYILHGMLRFTKMTRSIQQGAQAICNLVTDEKYKGVSGKYIKDGAEIKASEEASDEEKQKKLWELSGGYVALDGYEAIEVTQPPPEEEEKPAKKDKKDTAAADGKKEGEGEADGEAKPAGEEGETKAEEGGDEEKKDAEEKENKDAPADDDLKKEDVDNKEEEKAAEEKKEESTEKTEEAATEEKKAE